MKPGAIKVPGFFLETSSFPLSLKETPMQKAKLTLKLNADHKTVIQLSDRVTVGGQDLLIVGGPCSVESQSQMEIIANRLATAPVQALRGGVYKPRTSPYDFQGMGLEGLQVLASVRDRYGLPVITEVMAISQI